MATAVGPESMFDVKDSDEINEGPFYQQLQNAANRGAPYVVTPRTDGLFQQQLPRDLSYRGRWNNVKQWLDFDVDADLAFHLLYIQLNQNEYNNFDVPNYMPEWEALDGDGNPTGVARKWSEWRSPNHFHWRSQSTNQYAVPSTSWGYHISNKLMQPLSVDEGGYANLRTQREWDEVQAGLPEGDIIPWPST